MRYSFSIVLLTALFILVFSPQTFGQVIPEPAPPPPDVRAYFNLDPYYKQWIGVKGFPVLASEKVNPYALKEAAWIVEKMIGHRPDILRAMVEDKARISIIPHTETITDIPEYRDYAPDFMVTKLRGIAGLSIVSSEEAILNYPGSANDSGGALLVHEFAHGIHLRGLNTRYYNDLR